MVGVTVIIHIHVDSDNGVSDSVVVVDSVSVLVDDLS